MAALRAIPDSPWFMVARMDTAEVYAPLRARLWMTVLFMAALLLGAGASVGMVWRQQRVRYYRERHKAAEALQLSRQKLSLHFEQTPLAVIEFDLEAGCGSGIPRRSPCSGIRAKRPSDNIGASLCPPRSMDKWKGSGPRSWAARRQPVQQRKHYQDGRTISCEWFNTPLIEGMAGPSAWRR